jgi:hypothetical protein
MGDELLRTIAAVAAGLRQSSIRFMIPIPPQAVISLSVNRRSNSILGLAGVSLLLTRTSCGQILSAPYPQHHPNQ